MNDTMLKIRSSRLFQNIMPILTLTILSILFIVGTNGRILVKSSMTTILNQAMLTGLVATGAVFVFSTGNINIAMGGTTVMSAIVAVYAFNYTNSIFAMFVASIIVGITIMALASMVSLVFKVSFIVSTVIFMTVLTASQSWILNTQKISIPFSIASGLTEAKVPIILLITFFIASALIFYGTGAGRAMRMIGENRLNAFQTGINANKYIIIAHLIAGFGAGLGGLLILMRAAAVTTATASTTNIDVMLAIVLGGMPVNGGYKSKIYSGLVGALLVSVLNTGLLLMGVNSMLVQAVKGVFFLALIFASNKRTKTLPVREIIS